MTDLGLGFIVDEIDRDSVVKAIREDKQPHMILDNNAEYLCLYHNQEPVSYCSVKPFRSGFKVNDNFTPIRYRGKGYFTKLLEFIIDNYKDFPLYAGCLEASVNIYKRAGFIQKGFRQFKYFTITNMQKG